MKTQRFLLLIAMLVAATLWSCTADDVNPDSGETASASNAGLALDGVAHPVVPGVCSDTAYFNLIDESGSLNVSYCGFAPCDPNNPTSWGTALAYNTDSALYFDIQLAWGWYIEMSQVYAGDAQGITWENGIPQANVGPGWDQEIVTPAVNAYQVTVPTAGLTDCQSICGMFTVAKLDFFGGVDPQSRRTVMLHNPAWNDANQSAMNTSSMFEYPYCGLVCGATPQCPDEPEYCDISFACSNYEWIENVSIGTIDNTSGNDQGFGDYTGEESHLQAGGTASITLTPGFNNACGYYERWVVFIDWNRDGDFFDSGELVTWGASRYAITRTFQVPANAETCELRMRVAMRWGCWPSGPCCSYYYGEAEDYTIYVDGAGNGRVAPREDDNVMEALYTTEDKAPGDVQLIEDEEELIVRSGSDQPLEVEVLDENGTVVHTQKIKAKAGLNNINLNYRSNTLTGHTYRVKGGLERSEAEMQMDAPAGME